jgi:hypothetical protein
MLSLRRIPQSAAILLLVGATTAACGSSNTPSVVAKPPEYHPEQQAKSRAFRSQAEPLIVEWPAAARAKLETLAKRGLVVVRYTGDAMEMIAQCRVAGAYSYTPTTRQRDRVTIDNADELYAYLPLGAAELEGKLRSAGQLNVKMTIVGTYNVERAEIRRDELEGDCERATHVVTALTAGAFEFFAGAGAEIGADATAGEAGISAKTDSRREMLNQAGDEEACFAATATDTAPPYGCGALIRVEVARIRPAKPEEAPVAPVAPEPPKPPEPQAPADPAPPVTTPPEPLAPRPEAPCPFGTTRIGDRCEPEPVAEVPSDPGCGSPGSRCPEPGSESSWVMGIVIGTLLLGGLTLGIIKAATQEEAPAPVIAPAGLGTAPVSRPLAPVIRW